MEALKILVADDEPPMIRAVTRVLKNYTVSVADLATEVAFEVATANDGVEALAKIDEFEPDIVLLDYKMPNMTGLEVLEKIAAGERRILAIMITAYASIETAISAMKRGAYDFLAKPFTPEELKNVLRKAAGRIILEKEARRLAEEKRQVRFQFISVLAHELKAPLNAIGGYLKIVKDRAAGDNQETYDTMLARSIIRTEQMRKLITDLLDLTRIESGQKRRELVEVDVADVARDAIDTMVPDAQERGITINLHAENGVTVKGDRGEVEIILNNLVSNAVKYNRDNGTVDVTLTADDDAVCIAVADTGIGMSKEECAKLFGEFVRIKNAKTRSILGSGLGLSILKKLAALYDGDIAVTSEPDVGTTFTVTLSRDASASAE